MSRQSKRNEAELSLDILRSRLVYDEQTGLFTYLKNNKYRAQQSIGMIAGCINGHGYRYIKLNGISYRVARLAWFYVHGVWPDGEVDHINGNRSDDRISNL